MNDFHLNEDEVMLVVAHDLPVPIVSCPYSLVLV